MVQYSQWIRALHCTAIEITPGGLIYRLRFAALSLKSRPREGCIVMQLACVVYQCSTAVLYSIGGSWNCVRHLLCMRRARRALRWKISNDLCMISSGVLDMPMFRKQVQSGTIRNLLPKIGGLLKVVRMSTTFIDATAVDHAILERNIM